MSEPIVMKQCHKCKTLKPVTEFWKNRPAPDGLFVHCKECCRRYNRSPQGKAKFRRYEESVKGRINRRAAASRHRIRYPWQQRACWAVKDAIRTGKLVHPQKCKCSVCGKRARDYHHPHGYSKDHWLDVIPLCRQCHITLHKHQGSVPSL